MINLKKISLLVIILFVTGCSGFDKSAIPLYDEVFMPPEEQETPLRRAPPKNPLIMPPGYQKPEFNEYKGDENARLRGIIESDKETELSIRKEDKRITYPKLSSVPKRPDIKGVSASMSQSQQELEGERQRALAIQKSVQSGEHVPQAVIADARPPALPDKGGDTKISALPWQKGAGSQNGLRQAVKPITFADQQKVVPTHPKFEESYATRLEREERQRAKEVTGEATHEFGTPELVENGQGSTITHMYQAGYDSLEEMREDDDQFRLKPFEYRNTPRINRAKPKKKTKVTFNNVEDHPNFLPESRYRERRIKGPYYRGTYHGSVYFNNEY